MVSRIPKQYSKTAQKHFSPTPLAINAKDPSNNNIAPDARKSPTKINDQRKPVGRTTINSITAHPPPPSDPYARITIPSPLSREPSPPSRVVASGLKGNMFTQDDTDFMVKFISWELQRNPALTKSNLSYKLEAKVRVTNLLIRGLLITDNSTGTSSSILLLDATHTLCMAYHRQNHCCSTGENRK